MKFLTSRNILILIFILGVTYIFWNSGISIPDGSVDKGGKCKSYKDCKSGLTCANNQCYLLEETPDVRCKCSLLFLDSPFNYFFFCPSNQCNGRMCSLSTGDGNYHCDLTSSP